MRNQGVGGSPCSVCVSFWSKSSINGESTVRNDSSKANKMQVVCRSHRSQNFVDGCYDPIQKWVWWISKERSWPLKTLLLNLVKQIKHFICHLHPYNKSNTFLPLQPSCLNNEREGNGGFQHLPFLGCTSCWEVEIGSTSGQSHIPTTSELSLEFASFKEVSTQELPQLAHQTRDKIRGYSSFPKIWSITASTQEVEHVEIIHGGMTRLLWRPTKTWSRRERKG